MKVIVWPNGDGPVSVCIPSGHVEIEDVIQNDVPKDAGHRVVDISAFPVPLSDAFFDAVRMDGESFSMNIEAARKIVSDRVESSARAEARRRSDTVMMGLTNAISDAAFAESIRSKRTLIESASSLEALRTILETEV